MKKIEQCDLYMLLYTFYNDVYDSNRFWLCSMCFKYMCQKVHHTYLQFARVASALVFQRFLPINYKCN